MPMAPGTTIRPDNAQDRGRQLAALARLQREVEQLAQEEREFPPIVFPPNYAAMRTDPQTGHVTVPPLAIRPDRANNDPQAVYNLRLNLARIGYMPWPQSVQLTTFDRQSRDVAARLGQYDAEMQAAVARFQEENHLTTLDRTTNQRVADRVVGNDTALAINNFYRNRLDAVKQTTHSLQNAPVPENGVYVDLARQQVHVMRNGQSVFSSDVIIGKAEVDAETGIAKRTPAGPLGNIDGFTLHPQWRPGTIGSRVAEQGNIPTEPGTDNPLGFARANMSNRHGVFLHHYARGAAPIFNMEQRLASLGCIRVKDMEGFMRAVADERAVLARQFPALARQIQQMPETDPNRAQLLQHFDPATQRFRSMDGFMWAARQPHSADATRWAFDMSDARGQRILPVAPMSVHAGYRPVQFENDPARGSVAVFGNNFYANRTNWDVPYHRPSGQDVAAAIHARAQTVRAPDTAGPQSNLHQNPPPSHHFHYRTQS